MPRKALFGLLAVVLVAAALLAFDRYLAREDILFLRDPGPAEWIVPDRAVDLKARTSQQLMAVFRRTFEVDAVPRRARLHFAALAEAAVYLDGNPLPLPEDGRPWSEVRTLDLARHLAPGPHELAVVVRHRGGELALLAWCEELGLATGDGWEVQVGNYRIDARPARDRPLPAIAGEVPSASAALASRLWLLIAVAAAVLGGRLAHRRRPGMPLWRWLLDPARLQWVLLGAWTAMALNNFWRLNLDAGFDSSSHYDYIRFIIERQALPMAHEGWQMMQMPLFYLVASLPYAVLRQFLDSPAPEIGLRLIPLACGGLQILVARRALAAALPTRQDLQRLGLVFVAAMPMNLYMSQWVGNEPLAGLFSALVAMQLVEMVARPELARPRRRQARLAITLALAILTKVTAVLLVPVTLIVLFAVLPARERIRAGLLTVVVTAVITGGPFVRNFAEYGTPLVLSSSSVDWWQDPGYRVPADLWRFGRALERPIFASTAGFWDAVYSTMWIDGQMSSIISPEWFPPWRLRLILAGTWLALPLVLLSFAGAVEGVVRRRPLLVLATGCVLLYWTALLQQFLSLPIYSTAKATYTLGLLPMYAILFTGGARLVTVDRIGAAALQTLVLGWATFSYLGYFAT